MESVLVVKKAGLLSKVKINFSKSLVDRALSS